MRPFEQQILLFFQDALKKSIDPEHIFPVILMGRVLGYITQEEMISLNSDAVFIRDADRELRELQQRVKSGRSTISRVALRELANRMIDETGVKLGDDMAQTLKERIINDLKLDPANLVE